MRQAWPGAKAQVKVTSHSQRRTALKSGHPSPRLALAFAAWAALNPGQTPLRLLHMTPTLGGQAPAGPWA